MNKEKEIRRYLAVIDRASSYIKSLMDNDDDGLFEQMTQQPPLVIPLESHMLTPNGVHPDYLKDPVQEPDPAFVAARRKHVQDLIDIDTWPEAVPVMEKPSEEDQINRASAIIDMVVDRKIENASVLDFGCAEGYITSEFFQRGASDVAGYDIVDWDWADFDSRIKFSANWDQFAKGEYDIVLLYDVLDHCKDPEDVMKKIKSVLKPNGTVYVRCHPWLSKHGGHLHKQGINKAFLHLFLTYDEILKLTGEEPCFVRTEKNPIEAYHWWFNDFGITKEMFHKEDVSDFFKIQAFKELLASEHEIPLNEIDEFLQRMELIFADYVLGNK